MQLVDNTVNKQTRRLLIIPAFPGSPQSLEVVPSTWANPAGFTPPKGQQQFRRHLKQVCSDHPWVIAEGVYLRLQLASLGDHCGRLVCHRGPCQMHKLLFQRRCEPRLVARCLSYLVISRTSICCLKDSPDSIQGQEEQGDSHSENTSPERLTPQSGKDFPCGSQEWVVLRWGANTKEFGLYAAPEVGGTGIQFCQRPLWHSSARSSHN